jgi:hypothetical protein
MQLKLQAHGEPFAARPIVIEDLAQIDIPVKTFGVQPKIRYDCSLDGIFAFNSGGNQGAFQFGGGVIFG